MTSLFILTRAIHIGACLLLFAIFAFDRFIAAPIRREPEIFGYWQSYVRCLSAVLLPIILISGMAWFAFVSTTMSGQPLQFETLKTVWAHTQFGTVSEIRLMFWLAAAIVAVFSFCKWQTPIQTLLMGIQLFLSGCLVGSLAWAGHGRESSQSHLAVDILHLLAAGLWPAGLLPLLIILSRLRERTDSKKWTSLAALVRRFSAMSLATVALLAGTGVVNSWYLVGSISNLIALPYGRWLLVKIILFCMAVAIGAINLLRLKPRLLEAHAQTEFADSLASQLRFNILLEVSLGTAIVVIVAILGILPPRAALLSKGSPGAFLSSEKPVLSDRH